MERGTAQGQSSLGLACLERRQKQPHAAGRNRSAAGCLPLHFHRPHSLLFQLLLMIGTGVVIAAIPAVSAAGGGAPLFDPHGGGSAAVVQLGGLGSSSASIMGTGGDDGAQHATFLSSPYYDSNSGKKRPPFATIAFSKATLLSGGLTSCSPTPEAATCVNGLASARLLYRNIIRRHYSSDCDGDLNGTANTTGGGGSSISNNGSSALCSGGANSTSEGTTTNYAAVSEYIAFFDKDTAFVQMSSASYGINIETLRAFGIRYYFGDPSILTNRDGRRLDLFDTDAVRMLQANLKVGASDEWYGFIERQGILFNGAVGLIIVGGSSQTFSLDATETIITVTKYLRSRVDVVVVLNNEKFDIGLAPRQYLERFGPHAPDVLIYSDPSTTSTSRTSAEECALVEVSFPPPPSAPAGSPNASRGVWCCANLYGTNRLNLVHLYVREEGAASSSSSAGGDAETPPPTHGQPILVLGAVTTHSPNITNLLTDTSAVVVDDEYFTDQAFLKGAADEAIAFDPQVGTTTAAMPDGGPRSWPTTRSALFISPMT